MDMELYKNNRQEILLALQKICDYMRLHQPLEKCDIIIGCGCSSLDIPVRCAQLYQDGYAPKILFCGGFGKITKEKFQKSEAEIYRDIATKNGVLASDILIETNSTNTGDNFRNAILLLEKEHIPYHKVLIVQWAFYERRILATAKAIMKDKDLRITSFDTTFDEYVKSLEKNPDSIIDELSIIVGNVQRMIVYPQFGWQVEEDVPEDVLKSYYYLKNLGFDKCVISKEEIQSLIEKFGLAEGKAANYFC